MAIFEKVKEILVENLGCTEDEVGLASNLVEDLGADSLDIVELSLALEENFDISVQDEDLEKIRTVEEIVSYIEGLQG